MRRNALQPFGTLQRVNLPLQFITMSYHALGPWHHGLNVAATVVEFCPKLRHRNASQPLLLLTRRSGVAARRKPSGNAALDTSYSQRKVV